MDRGPIGKFRWDLDQRFGDEHGYRVQIACVRFQTEPLRLQRNRAAPAERVEYGRRVAVARTLDLRPRRCEYALVVRVLPLHQLFDDAEEPLPFSLLRLFSRELLGMAGGTIYNLRK